ncbi:hypothetical protein BC830DRAFT_1151194 [Chytriomyces sp. MP71]|nr:hypothetical protein BC830DRAFT_1151194 [Chytriomyces sp. MP71]
MSNNVTATLAPEEAETGPGQNMELIAGVTTAVAAVLAVCGFLIIRLLRARARCQAVARDVAGDEGSTGLRSATASLSNGVLRPKKLESADLEQIVSSVEDVAVPEEVMDPFDPVAADPRSDTSVATPNERLRRAHAPFIPITAVADSQNIQPKRLSLILLPENFYSSAPHQNSYDTTRPQQQHEETSLAGSSAKRLDLSFVKKATERRAYEHDHRSPVVILSEQAPPELTQLSLSARTSSLPPLPLPPVAKHRSPKIQSLIAPSVEKRKADMAKRKHIVRMRLNGEEIGETGLSGSPLRQEVLVAGDEDQQFQSA